MGVTRQPQSATSATTSATTSAIKMRRAHERNERTVCPPLALVPPHQRNDERNDERNRGHTARALLGAPAQVSPAPLPPNPNTQANRSTGTSASACPRPHSHKGASE